MSSDNYILIRRAEGRYVVTDESASVPRPKTIELLRGRWFDTFDEALAYADTQYSEYGVECDFPTRIVET